MTNLNDLIKMRMNELQLTPEALGHRLIGSKSPAKAAGRVIALQNGMIDSPKSKKALVRLPAALQVDPDVVEKAVAQTKNQLLLQQHQDLERRRQAQADELAHWRASFQPHAILLTSRSVPTQIALCAFTGGARRWRQINLDTSQEPITYPRQVIDQLRNSPNGAERFIPFFGELLGFVVNFSPYEAIKFDLDGKPLEVLEGPCRIGDSRLTIL